MKSKSVHESRLDVFFDTLLTEVATDPGGCKPAKDRLVQRARKKARYVDKSLSIKAVVSFVDDNLSMKDFRHSLDPFVVDNARLFITNMLERYTTSLDESLIQETLLGSFLYDNWRFGPGASYDVTGTHAVDKITQSMTCTTSCVPFVSNLRLMNPYFKGFDSLNKNIGINVVNGSKLTTVPKNQETERTIAIEPSGNMCLQLAAGTYLENALRTIGLDIRTQQPLNQQLARCGSIDGSFATIDLKSASNLISIDLVRCLMPSKWFDLLMSLRSSEIKLPNGEWLELHMMSTMGNGFTFPLMTLLITALIYGYRCTLPKKPTLFVDWRSTAVFGDDIIVPTDEYLLAVNTLQKAGFIVNTDKSYCDGPFRESCGGDYEGGVNITPFYVKSLQDDADVYTAYNQVMDWSVRHNVFLPSSLDYLLSLLRRKALLIPEWHNPDQGILTSGCARRYKYLSPLGDKHSIDEDHWFALPLAVAGYVSTEELNRSFGSDVVTSTKSHMVYLPRLFKTRYRVRESRLPKGYLDGWDPLKRSQAESVRVALYVRLTTAV